MRQKDLPTRQVFLFLTLEDRRHFERQSSKANLSVDQSPDSLGHIQSQTSFYDAKPIVQKPESEVACCLII